MENFNDRLDRLNHTGVTYCELAHMLICVLATALWPVMAWWLISNWRLACAQQGSRAFCNCNFAAESASCML